MDRRAGAILLLILGASPAFAGHSTVLFDAHRATPGIQLELAALPAHSGSPVTYRLRATGVPRNIVFDVWAKDFRQPFREIASGFRVDEADVLMSIDLVGGQRQRLDSMVFGPGPYPRGAVWEVALASQDRQITAFAKVIPVPIVARDGSCAVSLEVVSHRGERFLASGGGFMPGEEVVIESRYSDLVSRKQGRVSIDGRLPPDVILHASTGYDRRARYSVKGRSCEVTLDYQWGEAAFRPN
jgi:hypothetical protein